MSNIAEIAETLETLNAAKMSANAGRMFGMTPAERYRAGRDFIRIELEMREIYTGLSIEDMQALHEYRKAHAA